MLPPGPSHNHLWGCSTRERRGRPPAPEGGGRLRRRAKNGSFYGKMGLSPPPPAPHGPRARKCLGRCAARLPRCLAGLGPSSPSGGTKACGRRGAGPGPCGRAGAAPPARAGPPPVLPPRGRWAPGRPVRGRLFPAAETRAPPSPPFPLIPPGGGGASGPGTAAPVRAPPAPRARLRARIAPRDPDPGPGPSAPPRVRRPRPTVQRLRASLSAPSLCPGFLSVCGAIGSVALCPPPRCSFPVRRALSRNRVLN